MSMEFSKELAAKVAEEMEGGLFLNVYASQYSDMVTVSKHYYTVRNGIVMSVNNKIEQFTGDTLLTITAECNRIGEYNPTKEYKSVTKTYNVAQFCKLHKL